MILKKEYYIDIDVKIEDQFPDPITTRFPILSIVFVEKENESGICMVYGEENKKLEQSIKEQIKEKLNKDVNLDFIYFNTEEELLTEIASNINIPSKSLGWNIRGYDLPYIFNRIKKVLDIEVTFPDVFDCMIDNNLRKYHSYNINHIAKELGIDLPRYSEIGSNVLTTYTCLEIDKKVK